MSVTGIHQSSYPVEQLPATLGGIMDDKSSGLENRVSGFGAGDHRTQHPSDRHPLRMKISSPHKNSSPSLLPPRAGMEFRRSF